MEVVEIGLSGIKWFKWIFITGSPRIHIKSDGVACDLLEIHLKCISSYVNIPTSHTQIKNGAYFIDHGCIFRKLFIRNGKIEKIQLPFNILSRVDFIPSKTKFIFWMVNDIMTTKRKFTKKRKLASMCMYIYDDLHW